MLVAEAKQESGSGGSGYRDSSNAAAGHGWFGTPALAGQRKPAVSSRWHSERPRQLPCHARGWLGLQARTRALRQATPRRAGRGCQPERRHGPSRRHQLETASQPERQPCRDVGEHRCAVRALRVEKRSDGYAQRPEDLPHFGDASPAKKGRRAQPERAAQPARPEPLARQATSRSRRSQAHGACRAATA